MKCMCNWVTFTNYHQKLRFFPKVPQKLRYVTNVPTKFTEVFQTCGSEEEKNDMIRFILSLVFPIHDKKIGNVQDLVFANFETRSINIFFRHPTT